MIRFSGHREVVLFVVSGCMSRPLCQVSGSESGTWDVAAWSGKAAEALSVLNHRYERDSEYVAGFSCTLLVPRDQHEFLVAIG